MKYLLFLSLLGLLSTSFGADNCTRCQLPGDPSRGTELAPVRDVASAMEKDYGSLALAICGLYSTSSTLKDSVETTIIRYIKLHETYQGRPDPTVDEILTFLNKNKQDMDCRDDGLRMNYIHYAIKRRKHNQILSFLRQGLHFILKTSFTLRS